MERHGCPYTRNIKINAQGPYCILLKVDRSPTSYWVTVVDRKPVYVHRIVAQEIAGRELIKSDHVHHIDGNGLNNSPSNILILDEKDHNNLSSKRAQIEEDPF